VGYRNRVLLTIDGKVEQFLNLSKSPSLFLLICVMRTLGRAAWQSKSRASLAHPRKFDVGGSLPSAWMFMRLFVNEAGIMTLIYQATAGESVM
jgi:hypothetical protein